MNGTALFVLEVKALHAAGVDAAWGEQGFYERVRRIVRYTAERCAFKCRNCCQAISCFEAATGFRSVAIEIRTIQAEGEGGRAL